VSKIVLDWQTQYHITHERVHESWVDLLCENVHEKSQLSPLMLTGWNSYQLKIWFRFVLSNRFHISTWRYQLNNNIKEKLGVTLPSKSIFESSWPKYCNNVSLMIFFKEIGKKIQTTNQEMCIFETETFGINNLSMNRWGKQRNCSSLFRIRVCDGKYNFLGGFGRGTVGIAKKNIEFVSVWKNPIQVLVGLEESKLCFPTLATVNRNNVNTVVRSIFRSPT
jgi:hypothetical protein